MKELDLSEDQIIEFQRNKIENDFVFLGFLICENKLKPQSATVIKELNEAYIQSLMVTGDNPLTAISVGRGCCMIEDGFEVFLLEKENPKSLNFQLRNISLSKINPPIMENISENKLEELLNFCQKLEGKNCFALTGESFEFLLGLLDREFYMEQAREIFKKTRIFSRMKPHNKSQLILLLRENDHFVMMTGGLFLYYFNS